MHYARMATAQQKNCSSSNSSCVHIKFCLKAAEESCTQPQLLQCEPKNNYNTI